MSLMLVNSNNNTASWPLKRKWQYTCCCREGL